LEFFCEHNGENFGNTHPNLFLFLTKKQKQGKKSVKMLLTFFLSPAAGVPADADFLSSGQPLFCFLLKAQQGFLFIFIIPDLKGWGNKLSLSLRDC
jgi:hypothetical protein